MERFLNRIKKIIPVKLFKTLQPAYHYLLAGVSAALYGWPSEKIIVIGVTGTTGKTTSVYLIAKTLEAAGYKTGFTSTAMFNDGEKEWLNDKKMTMVGRLFTQKMLARMVRNGCRYAIVETTSEGVRQFRHKFINYDLLVFTGLYPEHIESHGSFENYKAAKGALFAHLKKCRTKYVNFEKRVERVATGLKKIDFDRVKKTSIINLDDEHADYFLDFWAEEKIGYGNQENNEARKQESKADNSLEYGSVKVSKDGTSFKVGDDEIKLKLLGEFNVANAMNAYCVAHSQGIDAAKIRAGLESIEGVAGRLERIDEGQKFAVIVDYAFEPNAVEKLYETVKVIPHNRIIHVLGSTGGGRDASRRPILGKLAGENADLVIVTNEDPYDEDPELIIDQVTIGVEHMGKKLNENVWKIMDRGEAIKTALAKAGKDDIVLITGKGSEQAICIANGEKITWDDRAVARGILANSFDKAGSDQA